jgi:fibronectin type 3 domain-containing protein
VIALLAAAALALPQQPGPSPLRLFAHGDTVTVFLSVTPPRGGGFVVYRGAVGATQLRITPSPVTAARDGAEAAGIIGGDLLTVERAVQALGPDDMVRRLKVDPFAGVVLSALYPAVGVALGRTYADTGLTPGAQLVYRVVFTDAAGRETARAFTGTVQVVDRSPPAPTGLKADVGDHLAAVSWAYPAPGPGPAENVLGFIVYRADGPSAPLRRITDVPVLRPDAGPIQYRDGTVTNGVAYRYEVAAMDFAGREGAHSAPLGVTPVDKTPPAFPTDVTARVEAGGVLLVWRMSPEPDAAGYVVERATQVGGPFARITAATVPVGQPTLLDTTTIGGRRYFYRVIALDQSGNASQPSPIAQANVVVTTPPAPPESVTATPVSHRLVIRWRRSRSPYVAGYFVYREVPGQSPNRITRLPVPDTTFVDSGYAGTGLHAGGRYEVGVSAVDSARSTS